MTQLAPRSGRTVHNFLETSDTGERRELYGCTARHVIIKTRQTYNLQLLSESECDGWYIDTPAAWAKLHPPLKPSTHAYITSNTRPNDEYRFTESGTSETGFAILSKRTSRSISPDASGNPGETAIVISEEVTELSEAVLCPELFVPPRDFKRRPHLTGQTPDPLALRARLRWEMLKDSNRLQKNISRFLA